MSDSNAQPARRTTRSITRREKQLATDPTAAASAPTAPSAPSATIAPSAAAPPAPIPVPVPPVQHTTRLRTRSAWDAEKSTNAAPQAEPNRRRKRSAPAATTAQRVTRSATAAAKAGAKTTTTTNQTAATQTRSKPQNKVLERARVQSLVQKGGVRYRTPTPPHESRHSEPASPHTPSRVSPLASSRPSTHGASSPMVTSSQNAADDATFETLKEVVLMELGNSIEPTSESYAQDIYKDLVTDAHIEAAFKKIGYEPGSKKGNEEVVGRWTDIPEDVKDEKELYKPFTKVATAIRRNLGNRDVKNTRKVEDTQSNHFTHRDNPSHRSRPDISIVATGNSFEKSKQKYGYSSLASFFEIKREADSCTDISLVQQTGVYVRQMFMYQPNRRYVRTIVITENHVRLIHFDRSGAQYSPWINIHEDPYTFVRLILGISSTDEALLGLDTNVQWTHKGGKKVAGTIKLVDSNNEEVTFDLLDVYPVFIRAALRGRGTTCWSALSPYVDEDGKRVRVLIKDAWRSDDRVPEYVYLEQAKGVNGVSRMLHYQDRCAETKCLRGPHVPSAANFFNRIWLRVVCEQHGPSLKHFKSQKQLLGAIRDAILTHRNLIKFKQILHRDISIQNVLLGLVDEDALPGLRGILIDLDMAVNTGPRDPSSISDDHRTGTRIYQSISVLYSYDSKYVHIAHDYLDDLESFFYILVYLIFGWISVEKEIPNLSKPSFLRKWDDDDFENSLNAKVRFMNEPPNVKDISPFWAPPCHELLKSFRKFIRAIVDEKAEIRHMDDPKERLEALETLHEDFEEHYQALKKMFDKAIEKLDEMKESELTEADPGALDPPPVASTSRVSKRGSGSMEDADEVVSPTKRTRTIAGARSRLANAVEAENETVRR